MGLYGIGMFMAGIGYTGAFKGGADSELFIIFPVFSLIATLIILILKAIDDN